MNQPEQNCPPRRLRIVFRKGEAAKYISHLDLLRAWERALRRAGLPLGYTQGFSPHPKITIAMPLALGCSGENEVLDVILRTESASAAEVVPEVLQALEPVLPPGISVVSVAEIPLRDPALATLFRQATYRIVLRGIDRAEVETRIAELMQKKEAPVEFRRKTYDLRPLIGSLVAVASPPEKPDTVVLEATLLRNERGRTGRPDVLLQAVGLEAYVQRMARQEMVFDPHT